MPIYKTKNKKDGIQQYRVCVNYTDASGEYRQKSRTTYGAAEAKLLEGKLQKELADRDCAERMTVQQLYDEYIVAKKAEVRTTSLDKSKRILGRYVMNDLGKVRIDKLSPKILQKWKTGITEKGLSVITCQNIFGELNAMINYAVRMEYIVKNPLKSVGNFKEVLFSKPQDKLHYYTPDEFKKYIAVAKDQAESGVVTDWGFYVFFNIAFYTGMRKGEINALKWSDIDGTTVHVRRSIAQKIKGGDIETPPKNKSSYRDLQIPKPLIKILDDHKARHQSMQDFSDDLRICGGIKPLRDTNIENHNKEYAAASGLPHIRIHDFRHTHATILVNEGINIQEIARRLGHAKIEMTWNTYSHLYPREEERVLKILNNL